MGDGVGVGVVVVVVVVGSLKYWWMEVPSLDSRIGMCWDLHNTITLLVLWLAALMVNQLDRPVCRRKLSAGRTLRETSSRPSRMNKKWNVF